MLGKGLESLIPKKSGNSPQQISQQTSQKEDYLNQENKEQKLRQPVARNVSEASETWSPSEARSSPVERSSLPLAAGASGQAIPSDRQAEFKKIPHRDHIFNIEINKIKPNPHQPRRDFNEESLKELANSIREHGVLQPLIVLKIEKEIDFGTEVEYQLIAGERRLRAARIAGLERAPVIIKNIVKDAEHLEMAIVENLQRADLNSIETARAYAKLQDVFGLTQREVAQRLGKSRETIANTLRLLNLPTEIQEAVAKNLINESQARLLLMIDDQIQQQNLFKEIISNNLSVRELRRRIRKTQLGEVRPPEIDDNLRRSNLQNIDPEIRHFQEQLAELLGAKVKIKPFDKAQGKGGEIIIDFYSAEEIEGIIKKLSPENSLPRSETSA